MTTTRFTAHANPLDRAGDTVSGLTHQEALDTILGYICTRCREQYPDWETNWQSTPCGAEWSIVTDSYHFLYLEPDANKKLQWEEENLSVLDKKIDATRDPLNEDAGSIREIFESTAWQQAWNTELQQSILLLYIAEIQIGDSFEDFPQWLRHFAKTC